MGWGSVGHADFDGNRRTMVIFRVSVAICLYLSLRILFTHTHNTTDHYDRNTINITIKCNWKYITKKTQISVYL